MAMDLDIGDVELPNNVLKFGYGINYKYMGKVSHSFDRFYIVTKFELPKVENLKFDDIPCDAECAHLDDSKPGQILGIIRDIKCYCMILTNFLWNRIYFLKNTSFCQSYRSGVFAGKTFSHTPDEARSVGLVKACVLQKYILFQRKLVRII